MKKRVLTFLFVLATAAGLQAQILYRISGNGLKAPSYIIGTYHLAPASFADSVPGLKDALAACKQVYGELDMKDMMSPESMAKMQESQMLPEGKTISNMLDKEQLDRLNALMREVMGMDMNNESLAALDKMTPSGISTTLTMMVYSKKSPGFNPMAGFDSYFQEVALKQGKPVKGFETVDYQLKVLYGTPLDQQVEDLMCLVDHFEEAIDMFDFITAAFYSQDLSQIESELAAEESEDPCAGKPEDNARLLTDRNHNWVKMMPEIMSATPTFFAVGAGHLVGDEGVLHLLEKEGFTIEGVK